MNIVEGTAKSICARKYQSQTEHYQEIEATIKQRVGGVRKMIVKKNKDVAPLGNISGFCNVLRQLRRDPAQVQICSRAAG